MGRNVAQSQVHTNWASTVWPSTSSRFICYYCPLPHSHTPHPPTPILAHSTPTPVEHLLSSVWHALPATCGSDYTILPATHALCCFLCGREILLMPQGPAQMSTLPGSLPFIPLIRINHFSFVYSLQAACSFTLVFISQSYYYHYLC